MSENENIVKALCEDTTGRSLFDVAVDRIVDLTSSLAEAREELAKWKTWHDAAVEDAKNWRRDAQELQGVINDIKADVQSRNIHLLSKHCWCEPTGHPWTQKGEVL